MILQEKLNALINRARTGARMKTPGLVASLYERVDKQRALNKQLNEFKEETDGGARQQLEQRIRAQQRDFHDCNGGGHSNPDWIIPTMDACIEYTFENYEEAERLDRSALPHAKEPWQRAISLGNISDSLRFQKNPARMAEAVECALAAVSIDPRNDGFWVYLALAAYRAGKADVTLRILKEVPNVEDAQDPNSAWGAYLTGYRAEFEAMTGACGEAARSLLKRYGL